MHTLIVDDEPLARNELSYLLQQCPEVEQIEEAESIEEALEKLLQYDIDLAFLDIHLTEESGLTLANKINRMPNPPIIIFATAYDDYALQAFEHEARDYLLKPFDLERVQQTVARVKKIVDVKEPKIEVKPDNTAVYPIQMDDRIFMVKAKEILAVEVNKGETTIFTEGRDYKLMNL